MNTENTTSETEEVAVTYTNGLVDWKVEGAVVLGLDKKYFVHQNPEATLEEKGEAKKQFFLYKADCKEISIAKAQSKIESLEADRDAYIEKANNIGKELSPEDKLKAKVAKAEKMLADAQAAAAELGVEL